MMRLHHALLPIVLLSCTLSRGSSTNPTLSQSAAEGTQLTPDRVMQLEGSLLATPNNSQTRAKLLGYYSLRKTQDPRRQVLHILWFIQNLPTDPFTGSDYCAVDSQADAVGYARVKSLWQLQESKTPDNIALLTNALNFFLPNDDVIAEAIVRHASDLEPKNPDWIERLAELYEMRALRSPGDRTKSSAQALAQRDKFFLMTPDPHRRFLSFIQMPRDSFLSGDMVRSKQLALQLLSMADDFHDDPARGLAIHNANIILGRVALTMDDITTADACLIAAGKAPSSPKLASDGPDMMLAKSLLAAGERKTVHDYLESCRRFWTSGSARLTSWETTVDEGGTPDFGNQAIE